MRLLPLVFALSLSAFVATAAEPAKPEPLPKIDRQARARVYREEAAHLEPQIATYNAVLKPYDTRAADLRQQAADWDRQAAAFNAEAAQLQGSLQPVHDVRPQVQAAAQGLAATANDVRSLRRTVASFGGNADQVDAALRAAGLDPEPIASALQQAAASLQNASSPEDLQAQIDRLQHVALDPLVAARDRAEQSRAEAERRYRNSDKAVADKRAEIGYWEGERDKHAKNMETAEAKCAASAKNVLGVWVCTDLQSKAWFLQAQAGVAQADGAISLAQGVIASLELNRLPDAVAMTLSAGAKNFVEARIAEVEKQMQPLRDAKADLLARRANAPKQDLIAGKHSLAAAADAHAKACRAQVNEVYAPVAEERSTRDHLVGQHTKLLNSAKLVEHPITHGGKLG